ncbi:MAG: NAD(P)H-hydrate epimerase [Ignavibacteria bacterium GWC2_36_12]|nr:MAG: NAD(P)H-hydrate epimerase [Ignavibacteria bacterium GWC2_36_12]
MIKEFFTEKGIIIPAVTTAQMKEIDRIAVEETGPNLYQMMENAGRNLAGITMKVLGNNWREQNIIVIAGTGGNGGGGICAARHLANHGRNVKVCITEQNKLKEVPAYQLHILKSTNAKIISPKELRYEKPDLIIDALIGYNLSGEPEGKALELIKWTEKQLCIKISLDVPSGIDATSGSKSKHFIKPDLTLTLALPKAGLLPDLTGELYLGDIGIAGSVYKRIGIDIPDSFFNGNYIFPLSIQEEVLLY